jgi:hypothetical protein
MRQLVTVVLVIDEIIDRNWTADEIQRGPVMVCVEP